MTRLHTLHAVALLALVAGCAGVTPRGALSPLGARVTNEVLSDDAQVLETWAVRVEALRRAGGRASDGGPHAYAGARAAAWLAYARESYAWDPRDGVADVALAETRRIVLALEHDSVPELRGLPVAPELRARPDLWAALARARDGAAMRDAPAALAEAEVALVRASRLAGNAPSGARPMSDVERACELQLQVASAERLIAAMPAGAAPLVVALQGAPAAAPPAAVAVAARSAPAAAPAKKAMQRLVHFAVSSSELSLPSRVTLGEVIAMLRSHPRVNLVIEGHTDARGTDIHNRELALRRAFAVRRYLDAASLDLGRVSIAGLGADSIARGSASARAYARDRRVTLSFTGPEGEPLSVAAYHSLDIDHERDLQVEQERRRRPSAVRTTPGGAMRRPALPR